MGSFNPPRRVGRRGRRPRRVGWTATIGVATILATSFVNLASMSPGLASTRPGSTPRISSEPSHSLQWALPASPVGRQLGWLIDVASHPPVSAAEMRAHFDATFLGQVSPKEFNAALASLHVNGAWRIVTLDAGTAAGALDANVVSGATRLASRSPSTPGVSLTGSWPSPRPHCPPRRLHGGRSRQSCRRSLPTSVSRRPHCRPRAPARRSVRSCRRRRGHSGPCSSCSSWAPSRMP